MLSLLSLPYCHLIAFMSVGIVIIVVLYFYFYCYYFVSILLLSIIAISMIALVEAGKAERGGLDHREWRGGGQEPFLRSISTRWLFKMLKTAV